MLEPYSKKIIEIINLNYRVGIHLEYKEYNWWLQKYKYKKEIIKKKIVMHWIVANKLKKL